MVTHSGLKFHLLQPDPDNVCIDDIAVSLSRQCRFNGHGNRFYSIAEHCCHVCDYLLGQYGKDHGLCGLLHDAGEAYIGDITTPLKRLLPRVSEIEEHIMEVVYERFNLYPGKVGRRFIKQADAAMLLIEAEALGMDTRDWNVVASPGVSPRCKIFGWDEVMSREMFLCRFNVLRDA